jgi:hypothetical protein
VDHVPQVRLVEPHAERGGRDQRLDPVREQVRLGHLALGRVGLAGVGPDVEAGRAQVLRDLLRGGDGEAVDDPGALERRQVLRQPRQLRGRVGQAHDGQVEAGPVERPAQHQDVVAHGGAELLGDVGRHPGVGGRGRREDRDAGGQLAQERADPPVVGAEVVSPVGDAVRLVDDDEPGVGGQPRQHLVAELGVGEPLGGDEQDVDVAGGDLRVHVVPLGDVGGVQRRRLHAGPLGGRDLVAHERQQGGHQHGGAGAARPQQGGRDEVHGRLAPPGALHDECAPVVAHERVDRAPLVVPEPRVLAAHEAAQDGLGLLAQGGALGRVGSGRCLLVHVSHRPRP